MAFDVSFHPVPEDLLQERIWPWILGQVPREAISDLLQRAVRIAKVRFRAHSWGLGTLNVGSRAKGFVPHLHVWGRPFFITVRGSEAIAAAIDRYLEATPQGVDAIALEMLEELAPGLSSKVVPAGSGRLPEEPELRKGIRWRMDLMRDAVEALRAGRATVMEGVHVHQAAPLLGRELMLTVLQFAAQLRPGWMTRGYIWPSRLLAEQGGAIAFSENLQLVAPVRQALPDVPWKGAATILDNAMVGGMLPPGTVHQLRSELAAHRETWLMQADREGWREGMALDLQKIDEASADAQQRGLAFAEATEVYSGLEGVLN